MCEKQNASVINHKSSAFSYIISLAYTIFDVRGFAAASNDWVGLPHGSC